MGRPEGGVKAGRVAGRAFPLRERGEQVSLGVLILESPRLTGASARETGRGRDAAAMQAMQAALEQALVKGDVTKAATVARRWMAEPSESPRERAIEIAKAVGGVYRDFHTAPVLEFTERAGSVLPAEAAMVLQKGMERLVRIAEEWGNKVRACREERLARELRDLVREEKYQEAADRVAGLAETGIARTAHNFDEEARRRARYIGSVLGTCVNHPRETDKLLQLLARSPESVGLTTELLFEAKSAKDKQHERMMGGRFDNIEAQWTSQLKGVQVEIGNAMPGKNEMGDPTPEQLRDVSDMLRSVMRAPLDANAEDMWIDVTLILVDFVPKETGVAALSSGIEGRSYGALGFRARKAVALAFMEAGKSDRLTTAYLKWAKGADGERYRERTIEFMGALRSDAFAPFLVGLWRANKNSALREELSTAIGNLASQEAADVLLENLKDVFSNKASGIAEQLKRLNEFKVSSKTLDAGAVRKATRILGALGRIVRSPRTEDNVRRHIIETTIATVPPDNRKLGQMIATEVLAGKPKVLSTQERAWAIEKLADALWVQDQSTDMHKGGEREASTIGARAELAKALTRIGKDYPEAVLEALDRHATRYSGALIAAAEILQEMKDPRAVPVLNKMLFQAALFDESTLTDYQRETYWDTTDQVRKPLTKDMVVVAQVHALAQIGGPEAERVLQELRKRVQMGHVQGIGKESMQLLAKHVMAPEAPAPAASAPVADAANEPLIGENAASHRPKAEMVDPREVKDLIKAITASYLLTGAAKRAQAKIQALVRLSQITPEEAVAPICENLGDKDPMVVSAAISTLSEYAAPGKPAFLLEMLMEQASLGLTHKNAAQRMGTVKLLREIGPNRPEVKKRLMAITKILEHSDVKAAMAAMLAEARAATPLPARGGDKSQEPDTPGDEKKDAGPKTAADILELKRQYMQQRRQWIQGGKKGDPPPLPPGITM
ncbi:MAG: hypothetical protein PWP23_2879 [Candidatus Sumerlaeota bacterium]|nr:hypothetical protein [Candidatus Sumerlaeota bacterium]